MLAGFEQLLHYSQAYWIAKSACILFHILCDTGLPTNAQECPRVLMEVFISHPGMALVP